MDEQFRSTRNAVRTKDFFQNLDGSMSLSIRLIAIRGYAYLISVTCLGSDTDSFN